MQQWRRETLRESIWMSHSGCRPISRIGLSSRMLGPSFRATSCAGIAGHPGAGDRGESTFSTCTSRGPKPQGLSHLRRRGMRIARRAEGTAQHLPPPTPPARLPALSPTLILDLMNEVTRVLSALGQGDGSAAEQLLPLVYDELRRLAAHKLAQEKPGQTLQPTALVHEAYLRLVGASGGPD